ncbi:MAG: hypothetical protein WBD31_23785 [Rubripirellula sp.]
MRIVEQLRVVKLRTVHHRTLVNASFFDALEHLLQQTASQQLGEPLLDATGTITPTFNHKRYCGPNSLVRDIFSLNVQFQSVSGESTLKADVSYNLETRTFSPRNDHEYYLWTPRRRQRQEQNNAKIRQSIDMIKRDPDSSHVCPICNGSLAASGSPTMFDVRCVDSGCFAYSYHKDEDGRLLNGHYFPSRPQDDVEP